MDFFNDYGLFLAKMITGVIAVVLVFLMASALGNRTRRQDKGHLEVRMLDESIRRMRDGLSDSLLGAKHRRQVMKARRKAEKIKRKDRDGGEKPRVFVLNFKGDLRASPVNSLREEITAILGEATESDEVVVRLESGGGMVHGYGLAASQLDRIRQKGIPLTVCVDKVAASGGYMMACVADKILAAPFAMVGSIGVVAQMPNFHRLLQKHEVDYEVLTAGEYKRTLTLFGENTERAREKFQDDLQEIHDQFKDFIGRHRQNVDMDRVATGEVWLGTRARELNLVDEVMTSDEYITSKLDDARILEVSYVYKKSLPEKVGLAAEESVDGVLMRWARRFRRPDFFS